MADTNIKFYIQIEDGTLYDLETGWTIIGSGSEPSSKILYSKCTGLLNKGKRADIHTETYADCDEIRIWLGDKIVREPTTITLSLYFTGRYRQDVFKSFMRTVENQKVSYWDTARLKKAYMVLIDAVTITEDVYNGSTPYMLCEFKFQNLWGECKDCDVKGNIK